MATWIAHLRVAEHVHRRCEQRSLEDFLVGNIAPDSGQLNDDKRSYSPPADLTHYSAQVGRRWKREDLRFYREHIAPLDESHAPAGEISFKMGYYCHLLVDNLWSYYVFRPARTAHSDRFAGNPDFVWDIKRDWYTVDEQYLRRNPAWSTWIAFGRADCDRQYLPFYSPAAITDKVREIRDRYAESNRDHQLQGYFGHPQMDMFVELSARLVVESIAIARSASAGEATSTLELLQRTRGFLSREYGDLAADHGVVARSEA